MLVGTPCMFTSFCLLAFVVFSDVFFLKESSHD
jgi:hypothetical protein